MIRALDAVLSAVAVGAGLARDVTPLRHRPRVDRALDFTARIPVARWAFWLPIAALGGAYLGARRAYAWRAAQREMRSGRW